MSKKHKRQPAQPQVREPRIRYIAAGLTIDSDMPPPSAVQFDQHGRPVSWNNVVGNDVALRSWKRTKRDRIEEVLRTLRPNGIPPRTELRDADLVREVRACGISETEAGRKTILRAAGRIK
jgi:hypothetical protein